MFTNTTITMATLGKVPFTWLPLDPSMDDGVQNFITDTRNNLNQIAETPVGQMVVVKAQLPIMPDTTRDVQLCCQDIASKLNYLARIRATGQLTKVQPFSRLPLMQATTSERNALGDLYDKLSICLAAS